jgi:hypothetical protein
LNKLIDPYDQESGNVLILFQALSKYRMLEKQQDFKDFLDLCHAAIKENTQAQDINLDEGLARQFYETFKMELSPIVIDCSYSFTNIDRCLSLEV